MTKVVVEVVTRSRQCRGNMMMMVKKESMGHMVARFSSWQWGRWRCWGPRWQWRRAWLPNVDGKEHGVLLKWVVWLCGSFEKESGHFYKQGIGEWIALKSLPSNSWYVVHHTLSGAPQPWPYFQWIVDNYGKV